jgi:Tol biopolymer transport system component
VLGTAVRRIGTTVASLAVVLILVMGPGSVAERSGAVASSASALVAAGRYPHVSAQNETHFEPTAASTDLVVFSRVNPEDGLLYLWTMKPNGGDQERLTTGLEDQSPAWSPDRAPIAFSRQHGLKLGVFVIRADGSGARRLTPRSFDAFDPAWAPDGATIAFTRIINSYRWEIWLMRADGTHQRSLVEGASATWSPDGSRIAFGKPGRHGYRIYTIRPDGSGLRLLTPPSMTAEEPSWSPDGRRIVFVHSRNDGGADLWAIGADGSNLTRLTHVANASDLTPDWSPDGSRIVFNRDRNGIGHLYAMNADGSDPVRLAVNGYEPDW